MQFVRTSRYLRDLKRLRVTADEAHAIEVAIATQPTAGDVVVGLGGVRKVRFRLGAKGKSGGGRALYLLLLAQDEGQEDAAAMLLAFGKKEQADLSSADRKIIEVLVKELTA